MVYDTQNGMKRHRDGLVNIIRSEIVTTRKSGRNTNREFGAVYVNW
jgi:hypothetical protein